MAKRLIRTGAKGAGRRPEFRYGRSRSSGFTLVELLVVIAIIATLAAFLFPTFAVAKRKANDAHCRGNLHQLGIAVRAYADEHEERFPVMSYGGTNSDQTSIPASLRAYSSGRDAVFRCQADKGWFEKTGSSYDWNVALDGRLIDLAGQSEATMPSTAPMLSDHLPWHGHRNAAFVDGNVGPTAP